MADRGWKAFERRMARDMGSERIPVTGERDGADAVCGRGLFAFQFKLRRVLPAYLWTWLAGIVGAAEAKGLVGVLVVKRPRQRDEDAIVMVRWKDWCDLHGAPSDRRDECPMQHGEQCCNHPEACKAEIARAAEIEVLR